MGVYDEVEAMRDGEHYRIQIKSAPDPKLLVYKVGHNVPLPDGLHIGREGAFIVTDGRITAVAWSVFSKWGDVMDFEQILRPHDYMADLVESVKKTQEVIEELDGDQSD